MSPSHCHHCVWDQAQSTNEVHQVHISNCREGPLLNSAKRMDNGFVDDGSKQEAIYTGSLVVGIESMFIVCANTRLLRKKKKRHSLANDPCRQGL